MTARPFGDLTFGDLAEIGGLTKGGVQALDKADLIPHGSAVKAAKRVGVIGGFVAAGIAPIAAGGIATLMPDLFNRYDGAEHSNIDNLVWKVIKNGTPPYLATSPVDAGELWYHEQLYHHWSDYPRGKAIFSDAIVEVVDRRFVFIGNWTPPNRKISVIGADPEGYSIAGFIKSWDRSGNVNVDPAYEEKSGDWISNIRQNATASLRVNISLAIRNGFDRLVEYKTGKWKR